MEAIVILWVLLCLLCGFVLSDKKSGFWGTFFLCLFLSPLLGVIISATSGNKEVEQTKKQTKSVEKEKMLKEIENLKKEEELDLISEEDKVRLDEFIALYKNYDEWYSYQLANKTIERKEQSKSDWINLLKVIAIVFAVMIIIWLLLILSMESNV